MPSREQIAHNKRSSSSEAVELKVDHATICGSSLARLEQFFADIGLRTIYGGTHPDNSTQMSLVGFEDGSYLELMAPADRETLPIRTLRWSAMMAGDAGPCSWAARVDNIGTELERLSKLGVAVSRLTPGGRERPDGTSVEWVRADIGPGEPGAVLPFLIQDRTPRSYRVQPSAWVRHSGLVGIKIVFLAVKNFGASIELFRSAYGWAPPLIMEAPHFGATLARFSGTPVVLAGPLSSGSWLSHRLERFGESPIAFLIGACDLAQAAKRFSFPYFEHCFGLRVRWNDASSGVRLGIVECSMSTPILSS